VVRACAQRFEALLLVGGILTAWGWQADAASQTIKSLLSNSDQYHQQTVSVIGEAAEIKTMTGPRNLPFYTFLLKDKDESVTVVMKGKPEFREGDQVLVHGVFFKTRRAGRTTVADRIEATEVRKLHDAREPLVG
jgi:hypothetical protein